ncbi:dephospho-CoA kinase [Anaerostipes sp.]|uniref:dephospho-CoA kinase n=1 Tax=Anaerostipes sp. TaxID=1872530 RepID=UPI0025BBB82A|nr:dephospho-CoA kinase [Anaerostipes sp.]MBS7009468.1 dephospho-CoA kinase [Anaerostipes sp.]
MKKKVIGITGGVGSGKSEVLNILKEDYGAGLIEADRVAHELMEPGAVCYEAVVKQFGKKILTDKGEIDRAALGAVVFQDEDKLRLLNSLTHPQVVKEIMRRMDVMEKDPKIGLIVYEAALLTGAEFEQRFDQLWYVFAREDLRFQRLKEGRGYSDEKTASMIKSQPGEESFRNAATHIIDNSGSLDETRRQIAGILGLKSL